MTDVQNRPQPHEPEQAPQHQPPAWPQQQWGQQQPYGPYAGYGQQGYDTGYQQRFQGYYHQPSGQWAQPSPQQVIRPARNGFGITALCLGLVGLVFSLMPITGFLAAILGGLALLFGLLGWSRARRGEATNRKMAISGSVLGAFVAIVGIIGVVIFFQATSKFMNDMDQITSSVPSSSSGQTSPYVGTSTASEAAKPTSYTYEVTGNYRATQLHFTDSNGDMADVNNTGRIDTAGSKLPWSKTVSPEPNGNFQSLSASTLSAKGDSWITCTIKDNTGAVVATETGKGAYASCYASTPFN